VYYSTKVELSTYMTPTEDIARIVADQDEDARLLLCRHHNSLMPLLRLPEEILCHLFQVIQESRVPAVLNKLIHTCHALYMLALSTPGLWTYLDSRWKEDWLSTMVARTQMLPLSVYWLVFDPSEFPFATYFSRIMEVVLVFQQTEEEERSVLSAYHCDIIRSLMSRQNPATIHLLIDSEIGIRFCLKEDSLGASYGSLTSLHVSYVHLMTPPVLGGLVKLHLLSCEVTATAMYRLLSNAPLLETIFWQDTNVTHLPSQVFGYKSFDMVVLPRLRELHVAEQSRPWMLFAMSILPDPSNYLALENASDAIEGPLNLQEGFDGVIISRIRAFWKQRTGLSTLPPLSLTAEDLGGHEEGDKDTDEWEEYIYLLRIDGPDGFHEPTQTQFSWMTNCIITAPDPILATITRFELYLNGDRIRLEGNRNRLNVALLTHLKSVEIHEAFTCDDSWPRIGEQNLAELETWIRTFADAGRRLEMLTFKDCNPEMRGFVKKIEESGWVKSVLWISSRSEA
jgi:hypothetical protein